jgi:hypothetical protein
MMAIACMVGCEDGDGPSPVTVRDSSGIAIVENTTPLWEEGERWRVSPEPVVSIGAVEAPGPYQFYDVRGAVRLGTGEIVVADFTSNQIRWFDAKGTFVRTVGREGGGPDEFQAILGMWRTPGDSLAVLDYGNARMTMLGPEGNLGRLFRAAQEGALAQPLGVFGDGSFLAYWYRSREEGERTEGVHRGHALFIRWTPSGEPVGTIVDRPGAVRYHGTVAGRYLRASPPYTNPTGFTVATAHEGWYYSSLDGYEIEQYSADGELQRLIRRDLPPQAVTQELVEEWREYALERFALMPTVFRQWRANLPPPENLPPHGDFIVDVEGNLWVAEYSLEEPEHWSVFDRMGHFLGTVYVPPGGTLTQIGSDFVLGIWTGELDVEQVRVYHLARGG